MIRRLYNWTLSLALHRHALLALGIVAFVEASVFPIPPDALMIPMILAAPRRAFVIAAVATLGSVLGGLAGYFIGYWLFDLAGRSVLEFYGKADYFSAFEARYEEWGGWAVLIAGLTPFPYKVITILSGAAGLSLPVFMLASVIARGLRFFIVAALLYRYGAFVRDFIEARLGLVFTVFVILLLGGFLAVRYL